MLIDNTALFTKGYSIKMDDVSSSLFYYFDYDERSFAVNMEFQHFHNFYELCIYLDDHAVHFIKGQWYDIECFDIIAIKPTLLHKTQYPEGHPNKRLIINFDFPADASSYLKSQFNELFSIFDQNVPIYRFIGKYKKIIFDKLNEIYAISQQSSPISLLHVHTEFLSFLELIYTFRNVNTYKTKSIMDDLSSKIFSIVNYIHNHYDEPLSLDSIGKSFYISNFYLSHQFKNITGFTITDYIQMTRVKNAQILLQTTNIRITDIAYQCGFMSLSQFNRVFHKILQCSPSYYRQNAAPNIKLPYLD